MATINGNSADNRLVGTINPDIIKGFAGNDRLEGLAGRDTLLGGKNDDHLFGGGGNDILSGDGDSITIGSNGSVNIGNAEKGDDILVGGVGQDRLVGWGTDILVGGGPARYNANFIDSLKNDPFSTPVALDRQKDTFIALNKNEVDYTLTIVDYEVGIDVIDLRGFGVRSASHFEEIQDKGGWYEAITPEVNNAQLVLRINADPTQLTYL